MTVDQLFSALNLIAMASWLPLIFLPRARWASTYVPMVVPSLFAIVYIVLIAISMPGSEGGFSSLTAVSTLFADRRALLAGWIHYLAFDLFIGGWQVRDAQTSGVPHLLVVPALILTFLFGPAGLLFYLIVRSLKLAGRPQNRVAH
jgi:hypothetical protein